MFGFRLFGPVTRVAAVIYGLAAIEHSIPVAIALGIYGLWPVFTFQARKQRAKAEFDQIVKAQTDLLEAVVAVLSAIAVVEGPGSSEWHAACAALVALSDGALTSAAAHQMLIEAGPLSDTSVNALDDEQKLVLLRVAIDVATADGSISQDEEAALVSLGERLGFYPGVTRIIIERLRGGSSDVEVAKARQVLGVSAEATIGEIRVVYKKLMLKHHPDRVPPPEREAANNLSAEINAAYDLLLGRSN